MGGEGRRPSLSSPLLPSFLSSIREGEGERLLFHIVRRRGGGGEGKKKLLLSPLSANTSHRGRRERGEEEEEEEEKGTSYRKRRLQAKANTQGLFFSEGKKVQDKQASLSPSHAHILFSLPHFSLSSSSQFSEIFFQLLP